MTLTNYNLGGMVYVFSGGTEGSWTILQSIPAGAIAVGYGYSEVPGGHGDWNAIGDPTVPNIGEGFWYYNTGPTVNWVETSPASP
jgi:hypothetical protein